MGRPLKRDARSGSRRPYARLGLLKKGIRSCVLAVLCGSVTLFNPASGDEVKHGDARSASTSTLTVSVKHALAGREPASAVLTERAGTVYLDVTGGTGIGHATLASASGRWPDRVVLRMHLAGLERLQVGNGTTRISWSVPSSASPLTLMSTSNGDGSQLRHVDPEEPEFVAIDIVASSTRVPLVDGYFQVQLPATLTSDGTAALELHWVDFYRN